VGHRRQLHHVGVERSQPLVDLFEVLGRLAKVVVTDDPFRLAVARNGRRHVLFQIDVVDSGHDGRPEQNLAFAFRFRPLSSVGLAPTGEDDRTRALAQQAFQIDGAEDPVDAHLDHPHPLLGQMFVLGHHLPVPTATNAHTNHDSSPTSLTCRFLCSPTPAASRAVSWPPRTQPAPQLRCV